MIAGSDLTCIFSQIAFSSAFLAVEETSATVFQAVRSHCVKDHRNSSELLMRFPHLVECATCCVSGFVEAVA